ncbi:atlastin-1-like isoform X2 [Amphibalanus amphitrite]|uniref:atlastin-1-like isoform X2 n=1 Tax=Amphibalanus amphitrite TaxID=1232801 RepID=UPI001C907C7F|nr:atlastin-1-like isoform X2 [Amphibalanus amphitrite]
MAQNNAAPAAKQVLSALEEGGFRLHSENLKSILLAESVVNKPVVVISVAGAFRKGKSFLLDMMLRYLTARDKSSWLSEPRRRGFPWRSGRRRHTTGLLMWSQPVPVTLPDGTEAVILLMDTQGTFDNQSTMHESSTVFALSTLLSSVQIFNLMGNLQNDNLEHLQLFTEYGRLALQDASSTPFQKLLFLIRDWQFAHELPLGAKGGDELVQEWLDCQSGKPELVSVCEHIRKCFSEIGGFLLPHPGPKVAGSAEFDGSSADMDSLFVTMLNELMPNILAPKNLTVKMVAGNPLTGGDMFRFFTTYTKLFQSDALPKPKNILQATAETNNMAAAEEAKSLYAREMESIIRSSRTSLSREIFLRKHRETSQKAEKAFCGRKKMGDWAMSERYRLELMRDIGERFKRFDEANNVKRGKERLEAESCNAKLVITCTTLYVSEMRSVSDDHSDFVPQEILNSAHVRIKRKALGHFNTSHTPFDGVEKASREKLSSDMETQFRKIVIHNDVKKDATHRRIESQNMRAVEGAKSCYHSMMTEKTSKGALSPEGLQMLHEIALHTAEGIFESLEAGDECSAAHHLESLRDDINSDLESYVRDNQRKGEKEQLEKELRLKTEQRVRAITVQVTRPPPADECILL